MIYVFGIAIGSVLFLAGVCGLIAQKEYKELLKSKGITYCQKSNEHLLRSGYDISHGMVIDNGKLIATSKEVDRNV